jgi:hypothetical protein
MTFAVEAWAPEYGAAVEPAALVPSTVKVTIDAEVPAASWTPRRPPVATSAPPSLLFVDGVQRVEARVWLADGRPGICASFAAGAMRCDGTATLAAWQVRRVLLCTPEGAADIDTRHGRFRLHAVADDDPDQLWRAVHRAMGDLEVDVARSVSATGEPIVVDGPLRQHRLLPCAVGYVKSLHRSYGPPVVFDTVARLEPGERTPLFVVGEGFDRWSWYVRLPGPRTHALAGVVRCEAPIEQTVADVVDLADRITVALPRFASSPHKDTRAPQNLYPIAGLERELWRRLGDRHVLARALREAAAVSAGAA